VPDATVRAKNKYILILHYTREEESRTHER